MIKDAPTFAEGLMRETWFSHRVHPDGLEPSTNGLRGHCSTN